MEMERRSRNAIIALEATDVWNIDIHILLSFRLRPPPRYKLQIVVYIGGLSVVDCHRMQSLVSFKLMNDPRVT